MKKIIMLLVMILSATMLCACNNQSSSQEQYLRIHIRANSNLTSDQNIKYKIKDELVKYLTPLVVECESFDSVVDMVETHKKDMENICDDILSDNGFSYTSKVSLNEEYFPTRAYGEYVLESNFYDAIIVELGEAIGDNWWCVVYPPLCFVETKQLDTNNIVYKSKLLEIIRKFFD